MKMICPDCQGKGCIKCTAGYTSASIAKGRMYTRQCQNPECGFENGAFIIGPGAYPEGKLKEEPDPCIMCESEVKFIEVGRIR